MKLLSIILLSLVLTSCCVADGSNSSSEEIVWRGDTITSYEGKFYYGDHPLLSIQNYEGTFTFLHCRLNSVINCSYEVPIRYEYNPLYDYPCIRFKWKYTPLSRVVEEYQVNFKALDIIYAVVISNDKEFMFKKEWQKPINSIKEKPIIKKDLPAEQEAINDPFDRMFNN